MGIMYDGVLRLRLPNRTTFVGFAGDIEIVSVAKTVKDIEEKTNIAIRVGAREIHRRKSIRKPGSTGEDDVKY